MESLAPEITPVRDPHDTRGTRLFRTQLLTPEPASYADSSIEDHPERTRETVTAWNGMNGQQGADPAKPAGA
jgi:hypothetical protein